MYSRHLDRLANKMFSIMIVMPSKQKRSIQWCTEYAAFHKTGPGCIKQLQKNKSPMEAIAYQYAYGGMHI